MANFYRMTADTNLEEWVQPGEAILTIASACRTSSFQFLDHQPMQVEIAEDGGLGFPDFLYYVGIPLISRRFKRVFDAQGVDNLFYKPIVLTCTPLGQREAYSLALPPRIRAVREEYMQLLDPDGDESEGKELVKDENGTVRYRINASAVGNYRIFKLADVADTDILVTGGLQKAIADAKLNNVFFSEVEED